MRISVWNKLRGGLSVAVLGVMTASFSGCETADTHVVDVDKVKAEAGGVSSPAGKGGDGRGMGDRGDGRGVAGGRGGR